jgi:hypothetical protein
MNPAGEIASIVWNNRHLLHFYRPEIDLDPEEGVGCPLWVYTNITAEPQVYAKLCFLHGDEDEPCNPNPAQVAHAFDLPEAFTWGLASGWDYGVYDECEGAWDDRLYQFAGYLIGFTLRPFIDRLLPAG